MRSLRWLVPLLAAALFLVACGTVQTTVPELSEALRPAQFNECNGCVPFMEVDLLAGQHMKVGTVTVTNDNEQVCVTYALDQDALDDDWLLYETHLYVGATDDFPLTRANPRLGGKYEANPIPGQFPYGDDDLGGVEEWTFCVSLEELGVEPCRELYVAAHSVVGRFAGYGGAASATIYGVGTTTAIGSNRDNDGNIYVVDPFAEESDIVFYDVWTAASVSVGPWWYPNALAFDEANGRLYFSLSQNSLYFYDVVTKAVVNADPDNRFRNSENVLGATFAGGSYWYVLNLSDKLIEVKVDGDGLVTGVEDPIIMGSPVVLSQGDIVFKDGVIYGSSGTGAGGGSNFKGFFSYDINTNVFTELEQRSDYRALQLAWGLDGGGNKVLFGHQVEDGTWYTIDLEPYGVTQIMKADGEAFVTDRLEDLASGFTYDEEFEFETAWGDGDRFNERGNWGMWFTYKVCEPCVPASIIYGVVGDGSTGSLWQIEITEEEILETKLIDILNVGGSTQFYPNGLAYDDENERLYYAVRSSAGTQLFMYDFENDPELAATGLPHEVYGATWGAGKYWYIRNGSNDMRTVTFDDDGVNGVVEMFEANFAGGKSFNFGDIALDAAENVIYVSTSFSGTNKEFFKYDLTKEPGERYSLITTTGGAVGLQLGFGEDGVLYGHSTFGATQTGAFAREWFAVDKAGTVVSLGTGVNEYNDLASGPAVCD